MKLEQSIYPKVYQAKDRSSQANLRAFLGDAFQSRDHIQFRSQNSKKSKSLVIRILKGPAPKLIGGTLLLATGLATKVFGLATVIGAPILLPLGLGLATLGTLLIGWGGYQSWKLSRMKSQVPSQMEGINKDIPLTESPSVTDHPSDSNSLPPIPGNDLPATDSSPNHTPESHGEFEDFLRPRRHYTPININDPSTIEQDNIQAVTRQPDLPFQRPKIRRLYPPIKSINPFDTSERFQRTNRLTPEQKNYTGDKGSQVLSCVLQNQPSLMQQAVSNFLQERKGSRASVRAGSVLDLFLKHDATPNQYNETGKTPLFQSIEADRPWLFNRLINTPGIKPDRQNKSGFSAIYRAIFSGNQPAFSKLLQSIENIDQSLFQWAADCGEPEMLNRLLLAAPDRLSQTEQDDLTAIAEAKAQLKQIYNNTPSFLRQRILKTSLNGDENVPEIARQGTFALLQAENDMNQKDENNNTYLHHASLNSHTSIVDALIKAGADINSVGKDRQTPLHLAGNIDIANALILAGADINAVDRFHNTPLHRAIRSGKEGIANALIQAGAKLDTQDIRELTPLNWAVRTGDENIVNALIQAGAKTDIPNEEGWIPLHSAVDRGRHNIVQSLIQAGSPVNHPDNMRDTPLHLAAQRGHDQIVRLLIEAGANTNTPGQEGNTPLHQAIEEGHLPLVNRFIQAGVNLNAKNIYEQSPLTLAVKGGHQNVVDALIQAGAEVHDTGAMGNTLLHTACRMGNTDIANVLIQAGIHVNQQNDGGKTALHYATQIGNVALVNALFQAGANANIRDLDGQTALALAVYQNNPELIHTLIQHGATI